MKVNPPTRRCHCDPQACPRDAAGVLPLVAQAAPLLLIPAAEADSRQVTVEMMVVSATDNKPGVDQRLSSLASSFRYFKYAGYWLLSTQSRRVTVNGEAVFDVEGGR